MYFSTEILLKILKEITFPKLFKFTCTIFVAYVILSKNEKVTRNTIGVTTDPNY